MCGILGFSWTDEEQLLKSLKLIAHRGPDDRGSFIDEHISLGHQRLSIIDLSEAGHQPMFYQPQTGASSAKFRSKSDLSHNLGLVFNGEIYNYLEIRKDLVQKGYQFSTSCDTEVVLAAYHAWGIQCMERFNGMWALCIYDKQKQELILSRDRLGIKPLYVWQKNGKIAFGSELKLLISLPQVAKDISPTALNHFLLFGYTTPGKSMLAEVDTLKPGSSMVFDLKKGEIKHKEIFWRTSFGNTNYEPEVLEELLRLKLQDAVKRRLLADVPVGAFLSGGVDSSIIVSIMRSFVSDLKTFSVGFDHEDYNESHWSKMVASLLDTDHYDIQFSSTDVKELLPKLPFHFDEPFGDSSMIPTYLVSQVASEQVKVCLSGTGSDEIFGGYHRYREMKYLRQLIKLPAGFKSLLSSGYRFVNVDKAQKLGELLKSKHDDELYLKLFSPLFRGANEIPVDLYAEKEALSFLQQGHWLHKVLNFDQQSYLPGDLLVKEDRATMAHGLEGRVPFLDHELVDFVNNISPSHKLRGRTGKLILKKAYEQSLPKSLLYRKKQGFGVPLNHYFRTDLKQYAEERLFDFEGYSYYQKDQLMTLWNAHQAGKSNYADLFWMLISFNSWHQTWISK